MPTQVPHVNYLVLGDKPHLVANECVSCKARFFDRRNACANCSGTEFKKVDIGTTGIVRSFTIVTFAAPGVPLLQITDITNLKFTVNVPESELIKFKLNQNYSLKVDAYSEIILTGKATMIGSKANMGSSFPVQFEVNNTPDLKIKSGMFGKVNLKNDNQEKSIIIPASAIVGTANQPQVYLIKNGKSVLQNITISKKIQNKAIVLSGLNKGDVIVTNGFINLFDGANITVK